MPAIMMLIYVEEAEASLVGTKTAQIIPKKIFSVIIQNK